MITNSSEENAEETHSPPESVSPIKTRSRSRRRLIALLLLALLAVSILIPLSFAIGYGIEAYSTYTTLRTQAHSGVQHLLTIKTMFAGIKEHPADLFNTATLHQTQQELAEARQDFQHVQFTLAHSNIIQTVTSYLPSYRQEVLSAHTASQLGIDVVNVGQTLTATALKLAPTMHTALLSSSGKPLITASTINLIQTTLTNILPQLTTIQKEASTLDINSLPISAEQRMEFQQVIQLLPQTIIDAQQIRGLLGAASWLLGVDTPRTFLVQPMDSAELRATGGFTGQYGEIQIAGGRVESYFLRDISLLEYGANSPTAGQLPPTQYRSWWPFANWGLRDSNLSADFPTSAQIAISLYQQETGHKVDGVIVLTPVPIEQILQILGSIFVPGYNETITAQNLEDRLHYYQEDPAGLAKQNQIQPGDTATSARKRFTTLLAQLLIDRVHQATTQQMFAIARQLFADLKTKDLQMYFTNPQVESLLIHYGDAAQIDRSTTHDSLLVVQDNLSANKASEYVQTNLQDTVTLDAAGGATHVLHIQLVYHYTVPVYGYQTYFDYVRIYVPPTSKFLWGDGFQSSVPLCGGAFYPLCPQNGPYPQELTCAAGQYNVGAAPPSYLDPDGATSLPFDTSGPPTNMVSDEPGRAMFGGWVIVPRDCAMNVTLSWYVPPMGSGSYNLLVQKQGGTLPQLDLTILPAPIRRKISGTAGLHVDMLLDQDTMFTVNAS
jgi:hypothetical protein